VPAVAGDCWATQLKSFRQGTDEDSDFLAVSLDRRPRVAVASGEVTRVEPIASRLIGAKRRSQC